MGKSDKKPLNGYNGAKSRIVSIGETEKMVSDYLRILQSK
jgi:hypothetical protein